MASQRGCGCPPPANTFFAKLHSKLSLTYHPSLKRQANGPQPRAAVTPYTVYARSAHCAKHLTVIVCGASVMPFQDLLLFTLLLTLHPIPDTGTRHRD